MAAATRYGDHMPKHPTDPRLTAFEARLAAAAMSVDARLGVLLAVAEADTPARLTAAMRHAVLAGGKRLRPFLVIESAAMLGGPADAALDIAAALECVHCYSLVHDDLPAMDDDALRRGQPTVWAAFDEWTAILAGDALLTLAFEIVAMAPTVSPAVRAGLVRRLARDAGRAGMVGGQVIDLEAGKLRTPPAATAAHVERLQAMKTGALIRFAAEAGAVIAGATAAETDALVSYGRHLGLAFQISDDLLDATGTEAAAGKAVAKDAGAGKATLVAVLGLETARLRLQEAVHEAIAALVPFGGRAAALTGAALYMGLRDR
jgi:farnesyl diphosphate synthase